MTDKPKGMLFFLIFSFLQTTFIFHSILYQTFPSFLSYVWVSGSSFSIAWFTVTPSILEKYIGDSCNDASDGDMVSIVMVWWWVWLLWKVCLVCCVVPFVLGLLKGGVGRNPRSRSSTTEALTKLTATVMAFDSLRQFTKSPGSAQRFPPAL